MHETATSCLQSKLPGFLEAFPEAVVDAGDFRGDLTVVVKPERIRDMVTYLKTNATLPFDVMMDLFAMDYLKTDPPTPERFAVVYNLYSTVHKRRVRLKAFLKEASPEIDSIHDLFRMANWFEREAFDLFGIRFRNHPNLVRILCHNEFVGHPLRKDYPSDGYQRLKRVTPSTGF